MRKALDRFKRIDVLVNLAGGFRMGEPVHATSDANWNFLFDINARTLMRAVHSVVPHMLEQGDGKIVNVGLIRRKKALRRWALTLLRRARSFG